MPASNVGLSFVEEARGQSLLATRPAHRKYEPAAIGRNSDRCVEARGIVIRPQVHAQPRERMVHRPTRVPRNPRGPHQRNAQYCRGEGPQLSSVGSAIRDTCHRWLQRPGQIALEVERTLESLVRILSQAGFDHPDQRSAKVSEGFCTKWRQPREAVWPMLRRRSFARCARPCEDKELRIWRYACSPLASATNGAALRVEGGVVRSIG